MFKFREILSLVDRAEALQRWQGAVLHLGVKMFLGLCPGNTNSRVLLSVRHSCEDIAYNLWAFDCLNSAFREKFDRNPYLQVVNYWSICSGKKFDFVITVKGGVYNFSRIQRGPSGDIRKFVQLILNLATKKRLSLAIVPHNMRGSEKLVKDSGRLLSYHTIGQRRNTMHYKPGDISGRIFLDPEGFSGASYLARLNIREITENVVFDEERIDCHIAEVKSEEISKYQQSNEPIQGYGFFLILLQVAGDESQTFAYIPMLTMLSEVVDLARRKNQKVVIKRHPLCKSRSVEERLNEHGSDVSVSDASLHALLSRASAVFTVNSGAGGEALAYDVPVFRTGMAEYGCVSRVLRTVRDIHEISCPVEDVFSPQQKKRFLDFYRYTAQVPVWEKSAQCQVERLCSLFWPIYFANEMCQ